MSEPSRFAKIYLVFITFIADVVLTGLVFLVLRSMWILVVMPLVLAVMDGVVFIRRRQALVRIMDVLEGGDKRGS